MDAIFTPDPQNGAGHGLITISPIQNIKQPFFCIVNTSDNLSLTPNGWQNSEFFIKPNTWIFENNELRMSIGQDIVNELDRLDRYKVLIRDETNNIGSTNLIIDDIIGSPMTGGYGLGAQAKEKTNIPPLEPITEDKKEKDPTILEDQPLPENNTVHIPNLEMSEEKKSKLPLIIGILLLIALLASLAWCFFMYKDEILSLFKDTPTQQIEKSNHKDNKEPNKNQESLPEDINKLPNNTNNIPQDKKNENANPTPTEKAPNTSPQENTNSTKTLTPMQSARELLRKTDTGEKSYDLATQLNNQGNTDQQAQDAIFLLLEDAAQKGIGDAMLGLGNYYDPTHSGAKGTISPDANEAYNWYNKAKNAGIINAENELNRLKTWTQNEAKKNNPLAKELLQKWNK